MCVVRAAGSSVSAPAAWARSTRRAEQTDQDSSSHSSIAAREASRSQRISSVARDVVAAEGAERPLQHGCASARAVRDQHGEAVEQKIGGARGSRRWRGRPRGLGDLAHTAGAGQTADQHRRGQRVQVGLARERDVERLQPLGRPEHQRESVATTVHGARDLGAQQVDPGVLERDERPGLRPVEQCHRLVERAGLVLRLGGGERALRPAPGIGRQDGRPFVEGRGRRHPATGPRAIGGALQLGSDVLVRPGSRLRAVPRAPVGVDLRVGHLRQRPVRVPALGRGRRPVDRRAHERMPELHQEADLDQRSGRGGRQRVRRDAKLLCRAPQQRRVADRLRRRDEQQSLRVDRQALEPPEKALLDPSRQRPRV